MQKRVRRWRSLVARTRLHEQQPVALLTVAMHTVALLTVLTVAMHTVAVLTVAILGMASSGLWPLLSPLPSPPPARAAAGP